MKKLKNGLDVWDLGGTKKKAGVVEVRLDM